MDSSGVSAGMLILISGSPFDSFVWAILGTPLWLTPRRLNLRGLCFFVVRYRLGDDA